MIARINQRMLWPAAQLITCNASPIAPRARGRATRARERATRARERASRLLGEGGTIQTGLPISQRQGA
jgi:hypothetical protein